MTVDDLLKVLSNPDMIRIINDGSDVYVGYLGTMQYHKGDLSKIMKQEVHSFRCIPESVIGIGEKRDWMPLFFRTRYRPMRMRICRAHYITQFTYKGVKMKKTEGKRTSVAEYVRKRACGESAGPGKEAVLSLFVEKSVAAGGSKKRFGTASGML